MFISSLLQGMRHLDEHIPPQLIAVRKDLRTDDFSMISEMMINGNILYYIREKEANRLRLARPLVVNAPLGRNH